MQFPLTKLKPAKKKELAAVLQAPNQLWYYVFFPRVICNLFCTECFCNRILQQKRASGYQDSDHSPRIRQIIFIQQAGRTGHSPNTRQSQHPRYLKEEAT